MNMAVGYCLVILCLFVGVLADKPGNCPLLPNTDGRLSCQDDFGCKGQMKCCSGICAFPECDPGTTVAECLVNPCDNASCDSVPEAQCITDPCSDNCGVTWYTREGDVTHLCTGSELEEEEDADHVDWGSLTKTERKALRKEKKAMRLANKTARLEQQAAKADGMGDKHTARDARKAARKGRKQERQQAKELRKQQRMDKNARKLARKQKKRGNQRVADRKQDRKQARKQARIDARAVKKAGRREMIQTSQQRRKAERQEARRARKEDRNQLANE